MSLSSWAVSAGRRTAAGRRSPSRRSPPPSLQLSIVEIGHIPFHNPDREPDPPAAWTDLRQSLVFLSMPAPPQPEAYIGGAAELFDADGAVVEEPARQLLEKFLQAFAAWVAANSRG